MTNINPFLVRSSNTNPFTSQTGNLLFKIIINII